MISLRVQIAVAFGLLFAVGCRSAYKGPCDQPVPDGPPSNRPASLPLPPDVTGSAGTGSLIGYFADSATGMGIPRVTVAVRTDTTQFESHSTQTDTAGGFLLRDLPPGDYRYYAFRPDYGLAGGKIQVDARKVDTLQLRIARPTMSVCTSVTTS
jgi:hypothetical protein